MADGKLTIDKFIDKFKVAGYQPAIIDVITKLNDINLAQDFFIKGLSDIDFSPYVLPKVRKVFSKGVQFLTWIEHEGKSFWLFPVIFYKNNDLAEMINGVHSIIELRKMVIKLYNDVSSDGEIDKNIKVGIFGNYNEEFDKLNSAVDEKSLYLRRRLSKIIEDNINEVDNVTIIPISHQFEKVIKREDLDIFLVSDGFMGNMLYRAWISMGFITKHVSLVYLEDFYLPLWLGKSVQDLNNQVEPLFAIACKGLKDKVRKEKFQNNKCALIITNQVDACIRALGGLIRYTGLPDPIMFNLSTGTGTYTDAYPADIKQQVLRVIRDTKCNFLCFSIVDLFLNRTIDLIRYLKKETGLPTIVGGIHAELYSQQTIEIDVIDAICTGEAYESFIKVLLYWDKRFDLDLPDFWFKKENGEIKKNKLTPFYHDRAFESVPIPDYSYVNYHLLDGVKLRDISNTPDAGPFKVEQHQIGHEGSVIYSSMGGCSNRCSFCNLTTQVELRKIEDPDVRTFRQKPMSLVKNELEALTNYNRSMKFICIMENDFTCRSPKDVKEYCELISSICKVPFYTMVSPNTLNENKLRAMVDNGLKEINMGIQTNQGFNIKYYDRMITDDKILEIVGIINKYKDNVYPFYDFINFNPEEPDESMLKTINLICNFPKPFDFVIHHLTLGEELLLYKRLMTEKKVPGEEVKRTGVSDYHNLKFDDYKGWKTLYLNLFLEWIAGPHNEEFAGRIPRKLEKLKETKFGRRLFDDERIKGIDIDPHTDIYILFTRTLFDVLNSTENRDFLKELNDLLPSVRYTNQK